MAFPILPILSFLKHSSTVAAAITTLMKQFNKLKENSIEEKEFREVLNIQSELNEKLEKQIMHLEYDLVNLQKSLRVFLWLAVAAALLSIIAIIIAIF